MNSKTKKNKTLPEGWREVRLSEVADIKGGKRLPRSRTLVDYDTGCPYIRVADMHNGGIHEKNIKFIPRDISSSLKRYKIYKDDLFITVAGTLGMIGEIPGTLNGANLTENANKITNIKLNKKYLMYYLQSPFIQKRISTIKTVSALPKLAIERINDFRIATPSLPEQKAIASLLETWDTAIEKTEALTAAKQKRFDALVALLINQQCQKWMHCKVGYLFSIVSKRNTGNKELLSVTQDRGVLPRTMLEGRVMSPAGSTTNYKIVEAGNFVISLRSFQGGIEYSRHSGAVSPAYSVLKSKKPICDSFYKHFLKSHVFVNKYLKVAVIGIRDGKQISFPDFESVKLPYPPLHEQKKIATMLDVSEKEITLLGQLSKKYRTQKRGLMQKLLAGEWREK